MRTDALGLAVRTANDESRKRDDRQEYETGRCPTPPRSAPMLPGPARQRRNDYRRRGRCARSADLARSSCEGDSRAKHIDPHRSPGSTLVAPAQDAYSNGVNVVQQFSLRRCDGVEEIVFPPSMVVRRLVDPVVDRVGFGVMEAYVELVWLPVIGPSATWMLRRLGA